MRKLLVAMLAGSLVFGAASPAGAAVGPEFQVFTDGVNDGAPGSPDFTPSWQDLTAGYIVETDDEIQFTWEVVDLPDLYAGNLPTFHWEFALFAPDGESVPCGEPGNRCFSVKATILVDGSGSGAIESNCAGSPVVECETLDADVNVTYDTTSNQVTAAVKRADLGDPQDGELLADIVLFQGIAAFTNLGVPGATPPGVPSAFVCSCVMDTAFLDAGIYEMGTNRT